MSALVLIPFFVKEGMGNYAADEEEGFASKVRYELKVSMLNLKSQLNQMSNGVSPLQSIRLRGLLDLCLSPLLVLGRIRSSQPGEGIGVRGGLWPCSYLDHSSTSQRNC